MPVEIVGHCDIAVAHFHHDLFGVGSNLNQHGSSEVAQAVEVEPGRTIGFGDLRSVFVARHYSDAIGDEGDKANHKN